MSFSLPKDPAMDPIHPKPSSDPIYFGRRGAPYRPDPRLIDAANAALALGMPLLVTGEPGCGKTDFAFAVARYVAHNVLEIPWDPKAPYLLECYIRSETRAQDLLYSYDVVARFGDAYLEDKTGKAKDPRHYIQLEPLGMAFVDPQRRVVLVDEIDKAPRDLPNDLLRELDQGWFEVSEIQSGLGEVSDLRYGQRLGRIMGDRNRPADRRPFLIITSNAERQLPDPFLRRCVFYHLEFPMKRQIEIVLRDHLNSAGSPPGPADDWVTPAVEVFEKLRSPAMNLLKKPSTSELLNWGTMVNRGGAVDQRAVKLTAQQILANDNKIEWQKTPHIGCLVKLHADFKTLGLLSR